MIISLRKICITACCVALFSSACNHTSEKSKTGKVDSSAVTFSHRVEVEYAEGFRISYHDNYKLLEILNPFQNRVDTLRYSLVPRELTKEVDVSNAREIAIPVRSMITTSTTHIGLTDMLNANDVITGMVGAEYVYNDEIRTQLEAGKITGFPMGEFNKEQALALGPDILMISGGQSSQFDNYRVLIDSGIDVLVNSEWLETTPLGKAEWVKVMAALLNKEKLANERFNAVAERYNQLKTAVEGVEEKPLVINNLSFKGSWHVPGGNSYTATFLRDAGANFPWSDSEETGALQKDFEVVYAIGLEADIWLNPGTAETKQDILTNDSRFKDFKPFQTGEIYNNIKRVKISGGNDFWESGVVHPEILLADLVKIFHPEIVPEHTLYYYQKVK